MRLASFKPSGDGPPMAGEVRGDHVHAFADGTSVLERLRTADRSPADGEAYALADVAVLVPHVPRAIFGIGLNYRAHAREQGREPPEVPMVFMKLPSSAAAPNAPVRRPAAVRRLDYEAELAVVMGPDRTVAGYAVADDLTARDLQRRESQWTRAKGADGFCPFGPWVTTAEEVADAHDLAIRACVNGELRQDARTSDLIFRIPELIDFISEVITLEPGDLILTGTPSGVGMALDPPRFLEPGDRVRIEIEGLGAIEHAIE
jgi:acylpyruvate hydrolase